MLCVRRRQRRCGCSLAAATLVTIAVVTRNAAQLPGAAVAYLARPLPSARLHRGERIARRFFNSVFGDTSLDVTGSDKDYAREAVLKAMKALADAEELQQLAKNDNMYVVTAEGEFGIGIRETPALDGPRVGEDLPGGEIFEVSEVIKKDGEPTWLKLADGRGWVFDMSPVDPENPTAKKLAEDQRFQNLEEIVEGLRLGVQEAKADLASVRGARPRRAEEVGEEED
eukprot:TRINITY_DN90879_c0_g1_i1.p1 TRINITY_DN90879_c0_g1~~TRINITY_DN90879_c0_g1_i1.p1  ORF type:complete len:227 (+),score=64.70 TRINITY_DN90879_c0_g1_i1:72-752(+)